MTKKENFINVLDKIFNDIDLMNYCEDKNAYDAFTLYFNTFKEQKDKEKPILTDNGKIILKYMQQNMEKGTSKQLAEELLISARSVSGSMRKLAEEGFVEKLGENPIVYLITEKGKNIEID